MILLDTHVWIWWVSDPSLLSPKAARAIDRGRDQGGIHVSSISCWEVSLLVRKGRLRFDRPVGDWLSAIESTGCIHFLPVDNRIALRSNDLDEPIHDDPADRLITATAIVRGLRLVTKDRRLQAYPGVETLW